MAIEAKATLLSGLEHQLSSAITAADMSKVLSVVADQLEDFEVVHVNRGENITDDLLDAFIAAKRISGLSEKTLHRYTYQIRRMMDAIKIPTRSITVYHLRQYLANEKMRGVKDSTLEGTRQVLNAYFNWLHRERLIDINPVANLSAIKCAKKIKIIYSEIDIERMKFAAKTLRDRAIVCFLLSKGCRISEMVQLNRDDLDMANLECKVFGKGAKERTVYFDPVTGMLLREYMSNRYDTEPALFLGKYGERLTADGVRRMMGKLAKAANVDHVHPHKFRRTLATNLIRHGMPIQEVAAILGHDKLETTLEYVVLDRTDVKNSYKKYA